MQLTPVMFSDRTYGVAVEFYRRRALKRLNQSIHANVTATSTEIATIMML